MARKTKSSDAETAKKSFAAAFNKNTREGGFVTFPEGNWYAYLFEGVKQQKDGQTAAILKFKLVDEDAETAVGKTSNARFIIFKDEIAEENMKFHVGASILGRTLEKLELVDPEVGIESEEQLWEIIEGIGEGAPIPVVIEVTKPGKFTNINVQQLADPADVPPFGDDVEDDD